jgi:inorganic pyrophosphatase
LLALDDEPTPPNSEELLIQVMKNGKLIGDLTNINEIQQYYLENIKKLPDIYKSLEEKQIFKLKLSDKLTDLTNSLKEKYI